MGRPKNSEGRDTRQEILDAALELFAENGFFGTSMREIARAVGVRESAIYHHFANKEALFEGIINEAGTDAVSTVGVIFEQSKDADLRTLLERVAIAAMERFSTIKQRKFFRVILSDGVRMAAQGKLDVERVTGMPRQQMMSFVRQLWDRGAIRSTTFEMAVVEFMAPMLAWRMLLAAVPSHPLVTDYKGYARQHVDHYLRAVAPEALQTSSHKPSDRSDTPSSEQSKPPARRRKP